MAALTKKKGNKAKVAAVKEEKKPLKAISGQVNKQIENAKKLNTKNKKKKYFTSRGVVLIRNLPHGFYEEQLKAYFNQFGKVTRVRVVRSRKTTKSRGFAYVEFQYPEVAEIAAEAMNNYMMFRKLVKTVYIPPAEQKFNFFKSGVLMLKKENGKEVLTTRYRLKQEHQVEKYNRTLEPEELVKRQRKEAKKMSKVKKTLEKFNVDYDVDEIFGTEPKKVKKEEAASEDSESDIDDPEKLEFESDSESEESHELDEDVSEDETIEKKKKSIQMAKKAKVTFDLEKKGEGGKGKQKPEKKLKGIEKKTPKKEKKVIKDEKLVKVAKEMMKKKDQVKLVQNPVGKSKKKKTLKK